MEQAGLCCPEDVSLATIGDSPLSRSPGVDLTTVSASVEEEGAAAARLLAELIARPRTKPGHRLVTGGELLVSRTIGPPPKEDRS